MEFCTECGATLDPGSRFCTGCGAAQGEAAPIPVAVAAPTLEEANLVFETPAEPVPEAPAYAPPPQPQYTPPGQQQTYVPPPRPSPQPAPGYGYAQQGYAPSQRMGGNASVMGTGAFFGLMLLYSLPVIGLITCLIFAFSGSNLNRRNFSRAMLIFLVIALVLAIVVGVMVGWAVEAAREAILEAGGVRQDGTGTTNLLSALEDMEGGEGLGALFALLGLGN